MFGIMFRYVWMSMCCLLVVDKVDPSWSREVVFGTLALDLGAIWDYSCGTDFLFKLVV